MKRYEIHNQVTGLIESADTFEEAKVLQARIKEDYIEFNKSLFVITVLTQKADGSWMQTVSDEQGNMIKPPAPYPSWVWSDDLLVWVAPVPKPVSANGATYVWDEETTNWVERT